MTGDEFWKMFYKTGLPEVYTMYRYKKQAEKDHKTGQKPNSH